MVYQTLKYFLARVGLTVFLMMTLGFLGLYFLHEVALPQAIVNDKEVQWGLLGVCAFLGWVGHGLIGEMRISNGLYKLKDINLESDELDIRKQFEKLFALTYASCFLPGKGRRFRRELTRRYADYLLSIGRDDPESMSVYIKAFLQQPQDSVFRAPIIAVLAREVSLGSPAPASGEAYSHWSDEIDLLLDMLKLDNYKDETIVNLLAGLFLKKQEFSVRSEPLFVRAVESGGPDVEKIVRFVAPLFLRRERADDVALKLYLRALPFDFAERGEMQKILARAYYEGRWQTTDTQLHQQCGQVFSSLDKAGQEAVARMTHEKRISSSMKKRDLISREDKATLKKLKPLEVVTDPVVKTLIAPGPSQHGFFKRLSSSLIGLLGNIRLLDMRYKWAIVLILVTVISARPVLKYWKEHRQTQQQSSPTAVEEVQPVQKEETEGSKVYTVQIAAVFTEGQSKKIMDYVQSQGVEGLYVVESQRTSGGKWYKIRFGKFPKKETAQQIAEDLMEKKIIKNYFVLSVVKRDK